MAGPHIPESQYAIAITTDEHGTVGEQRRVGEKPRASAIRSAVPSGHAIPQPCSTIARCGDDLRSCNEPYGKDLPSAAGLYKLRNNSIVDEVPQLRWGW